MPPLMSRSDRPAPPASPASRSDASLAQRIASGDERAFEVLVQRHRARLVRVASQVLQDGRAEDAVQVALLATYRALRAGDIPANLAGWMSVVTRHAAIDQHRRLTPLEPYPDLEVGVAESAGAAAVSREELRHVLSEVAALPPSEREALLLRAVDGAGHREIGARMNVSPGQARQLIHRARLHLRDVAAVLIPAWFALRVHEARAATLRLSDAASASPLLAPGRAIAVVAAAGAVGGAGLAGVGAGMSDGPGASRADRARADVATETTRTGASGSLAGERLLAASGTASRATPTDRQATPGTSRSVGDKTRAADSAATSEAEADDRTPAPTGSASPGRAPSASTDASPTRSDARSPDTARSPERDEPDTESTSLPNDDNREADAPETAPAPDGTGTVDDDRDDAEVETEAAEPAEAPEGPEDDGRVRDEDGPEPPEPGDG